MQHFLLYLLGISSHNVGPSELDFHQAVDSKTQNAGHARFRLWSYVGTKRSRLPLTYCSGAGSDGPGLHPAVDDG